MTEAAGSPGKPSAPKRLSDEELAFYTSVDPFALTSAHPWEVEISSPALRKWAIIAVALIIPIHIFMGLTVDIEFTGTSVTTIDKFAFPAVGLVISILVWLMLSRPRVRANQDGVEVRNIVGTRFYPWQVIYGLSFPEGSRMARLELPDFEYVPLWAVQAADGQHVINSVRQFRELEARYMPED